MSNDTVMLLVGLLVVAGLMFYIFIKKEDKNAILASKLGNSNNPESNNLKLQAYERLTLLTERISLPNLISKTSYVGLTINDYVLILSQTIKQEFEYNITQQIYVSADAWSAMKNLKNQNTLILHQIASAMPENATTADYCRVLLEFLMNDSRGNLHEIVAEVLSYEAKQIM